LDDFLNFVMAAAHPFLGRALHLQLLLSPRFAFDRLDGAFIFLGSLGGRDFAVFGGSFPRNRLDLAFILFGRFGLDHLRIVAVIGFGSMRGLGFGRNLVLFVLMIVVVL